MPYKTLTSADAVYFDASALVKLAKEEGDETAHESRAMRLLVGVASKIQSYASLVGQDISSILR